MGTAMALNTALDWIVTPATKVVDHAKPVTTVKGFNCRIAFSSFCPDVF